MILLSDNLNVGQFKVNNSEEAVLMFVIQNPYFVSKYSGDPNNQIWIIEPLK